MKKTALRMPITKYKLHRSKAGFTLIELLVVSTITVLLMLGVSSLFMTFLLSNAKTSVSRQIKSEGNQMISQIEFAMRGAKNLSVPSGTPCTAVGRTHYLDEPLSIIGVDNSVKILSLDPTHNYIMLNADKLNTAFVLVGSPQIVCYQDANSQKITVKIGFTLSRTDSPTSILKEVFQSVIQLRNS